MNLPHSSDSEHAVLSGLMMACDRYGRAVMAILPDSQAFYSLANREIYRAIRGLWDSGQPVEFVSVMSHLEVTGQMKAAGGRAYVADVYQCNASPETAIHHARVVADKARLRGLMLAAQQIMDIAAESADAAEAIDAAERLIYPLRPSQMAQDLSGAATLTGFPSLDAVIGGFRPGNLVVVGALTSMGKTAFGLAVSRNVVSGSGGQVARPVLYVSLEMSAAELATRLLCAEGWISTARARRGSMDDQDWQRLVVAQEAVQGWPLWIEDRRGVTVPEIARLARDLSRERRVSLGLVVVDYLGLVGVKSAKRNQNREQEVAEISRGLKAMAGEIGSPVMALAQLSRGAEAEKDGPGLRHFRDSGSIEADADVALLMIGDKTSASRVVKIGKNRGGPLGEVEILFAGRYTRMESLVSPFWRPAD